MSKIKKQEKHNETGNDAPRLKSIPEVLNYLTGQGFKVARRTLYLHKQQGILREQIGGGFTLKAVDDYARRNLDRPGIDAPAPAMLADDKARLLKAQADKVEFDNELKKGGYLKASEETRRRVQILVGMKTALINHQTTFVQSLSDRLRSSAGLYVNLSEDTDPETWKQNTIDALVLESGHIYSDIIPMIFAEIGKQGGVTVKEEDCSYEQDKETGKT